MGATTLRKLFTSENSFLGAAADQNIFRLSPPERVTNDAGAAKTRQLEPTQLPLRSVRVY